MKVVRPKESLAPVPGYLLQSDAAVALMYLDMAASCDDAVTRKRNIQSALNLYNRIQQHIQTRNIPPEDRLSVAAAVAPLQERLQSVGAFS